MTERRLVKAALEFIERDGVLQGINLRDVAERAGVGRGNIYHYFGSRRQLLRRALTERWEELSSFVEAGSNLSLVERKLRFFDGPDVHRRRGFALLVLLLLDGDEEVDPTPLFPEAVQRLERDVATGAIHPDYALDLEALQITISSLTRGYSLFRRAYARRLDISPEALDERVAPIAESWFRSLAMAKPL